MAGGITFIQAHDADIPNPASGKVTVYFSIEQGGPAYKTSAGLVFPLEGPTGPSGPTGPAGYSEPPEEQDLILIPGPQGLIGASGPQGSLGPTGPIGFPIPNEPDDPEFFPVPGPTGATGASGSSSSVGEFTDPSASRIGWIIPQYGSATLLTVGSPTLGGIGTSPVSQTYTDTAAVSMGTTAVANNTSGLSMTNGCKVSAGGTYVFRVRTFADITNIRLWIGMAETFSTGLSNTGTNNGIIGFRYSTSVPDAGWQGYVQNTGVGAASTLTGSTAAIAASSDYTLKIVVAAGGGSVTFYVNGVSLGTISTNIPNTTLNVGLRTETLAATIKALSFLGYFSKQP